MNDSFVLYVSYQGQEYSFEVQLSTLGYLHKFLVIINEIEVTYEPDEERNYRAILSEANLIKVKDRDRALIQAVGEKLQLIHSQDPK